LIGVADKTSVSGQAIGQERGHLRASLEASMQPPL